MAACSWSAAGRNPGPSPGKRDVLASAEISRPLAPGQSSPNGCSRPISSTPAVRLPNGRAAIIGGIAEPPIADGFGPSVGISFDDRNVQSGAVLDEPPPRGQEPGMLEAVVLGDGRVFIVTRWNGEDANADVAAIWDPTTGEVRRPRIRRYRVCRWCISAGVKMVRRGSRSSTMTHAGSSMTVLDPAQTVARGFIAFDPTDRAVVVPGHIAWPPFPGPPNFLNTLPMPVITELSNRTRCCWSLATPLDADYAVTGVHLRASTSAVAPVGLAPLTRLGTCNGGVGVRVKPARRRECAHRRWPPVRRRIGHGRVSASPHEVTAPTASP